MKTFGEYSEQLRSAVARGTTQLKQVVGRDIDADLKLYNQMTPGAFDVIRQKYGQDALEEYIKVMEAKRHGIEI